MRRGATMNDRKKEADREERIMMKIIVDANGPEEQAMEWYYYLNDKIHFPFTAECISINKRSPLHVGERVFVSQMADEVDCENDMNVGISWNDRVFSVPLAQLRPLNADDDTVEAVSDWHYRKNQRYTF
jgi:hypothetical protein